MSELLLGEVHFYVLLLADFGYWLWFFNLFNYLLLFDWLGLECSGTSGGCRQLHDVLFIEYVSALIPHIVNHLLRRCYGLALDSLLFLEGLSIIDYLFRYILLLHNLLIELLHFIQIVVEFFLCSFLLLFFLLFQLFALVTFNLHLLIDGMLILLKLYLASIFLFFLLASIVLL